MGTCSSSCSRGRAGRPARPPQPHRTTVVRRLSRRLPSGRGRRSTWPTLTIDLADADHRPGRPAGRAGRPGGVLAAHRRRRAFDGGGCRAGRRRRHCPPAAPRQPAGRWARRGRVRPAHRSGPVRSGPVRSGPVRSWPATSWRAARSPMRSSGSRCRPSSPGGADPERGHAVGRVGLEPTTQGLSGRSGG